MPYIAKELRERCDSEIDALISLLRIDEDGFFISGEVNYCLSRIIWELWGKKGGYQSGNALIGILECVKTEFYRRLLAPYEDVQIQKNGDILERPVPQKGDYDE